MLSIFVNKRSIVKSRIGLGKTRANESTMACESPIEPLSPADLADAAICGVPGTAAWNYIIRIGEMSAAAHIRPAIHLGLYPLQSNHLGRACPQFRAWPPPQRITVYVVKKDNQPRVFSNVRCQSISTCALNSLCGVVSSFADFYTGIIGSGAVAPIAYGALVDHAGQTITVLA